MHAAKTQQPAARAAKAEAEVIEDAAEAETTETNE